MPNQQQIKNFYYSVDGYLFWVAGYTGDGDTDSVMEKIKYLNEGATEFAQMAGISSDSVRTLFIESSPRFKYMRVFYVKTKKVPDTAFKFTGDDFTMWYILTKM